MTYRDDRDALRAQLDSVQGELTETREQLAIRDAELAAAKMGTPRPRLPYRVVLGVALLLFSFAGAIELLLVTTWTTREGSHAQTLPSERGMPSQWHEDWGGHVIETYGPAPVSNEASCRMHLDPQSDGEDCRLSVQCAGVELYEVSDQLGYVDCALMRSQGTAGRVDRLASDGDPILGVDWPRRELTLWNTDPTLRGPDSWKIVIRVDQSP